MDRFCGNVLVCACVCISYIWCTFHCEGLLMVTLHCILCMCDCVPWNIARVASLHSMASKYEFWYSSSDFKGSFFYLAVLQVNEILKRFYLNASGSYVDLQFTTARMINGKFMKGKCPLYIRIECSYSSHATKYRICYRSMKQMHLNLYTPIKLKKIE